MTTLDHPPVEPAREAGGSAARPADGLLRPRPALWFEIVVAREDAFTALEALATTGAVEIEWHAPEPVDATATTATGVVADWLKRYAALARRARPYWPAASYRLDREPVVPADMLAQGVGQLERWAAQADPLIVALQNNLAALRDLELAEHALQELAASPIDFSQLAAADHGVVAALFAAPADAPIDVAPDLLARSAVVGAERLWLAVGPPAAVDAMARDVIAAHGRRAQFPDWLLPTAQASLAQAAKRRTALAQSSSALRAQLDAQNAAHDVAHALGQIARATWCFEHGGAINLGAATAAAPDRPVFARLSGWTTDRAGVVGALEASGARALATFPPPPRGARAPLTLANPWWARPFEVFTRLVGMPAAGGADPSVLLAVIVPLMFGYMFGDVGQGLVLVAVGWFMRHRMPLLRLLVPGGLAAALFGWLFGSVFCVEHWIHPLWVAPLAQPLPVLLVPVVVGSGVLALGLALGLAQAWWQRQFAHGLREDGPVLATYLGLLAFAFDLATGRAPWALLVVLAGVVWALAAGAAQARPAAHSATHRALRSSGRATASALAAAGELAERVVQLAINTLSFARVGAFALAHAGLSSAVVALAQAVEHPAGFILVLVLGNLLILLIEGLVVSIQTTRLVLFEFFTRFFKAEGRAFRPLAPPPVAPG